MILVLFRPLLIPIFMALVMPWMQARDQQPDNANRINYRGLCVVNQDVAWVSGSQGTVRRTINGGKNWDIVQVPGAEKLDFRDIEAFSAEKAYVLSIGPGEQSRIYKTSDGGATWKLQFQNKDAEAFYDSIAFWDEQHGLAMSDPVKGYYRLLATDDGGASWKPLPITKMPSALENEGAFAASGTCLITRGTHDAWFVTGGARVARVFHTTDRGQSWSVSETPVLAGQASAGIFSIAFKDSKTGLIVGGDYQKPGETIRTAAMTSDGGKTWNLISSPLPFCSCVVWSNDRWIAAGTKGVFSSKNGLTWEAIDQRDTNVISSLPTGLAWAAGPKGHLVRLSK